ncbi:MAG: homoserine kinase [Proteobacteria bacterium]|nr:homoserine kinase [Pseudomonadota bacterium]MDA1059654.1 homoserine kinase [Pseudomonadota bacterium]
MAVYTEITDDELAAFVSAYDIGRIVSFKGIAEGVENSNYLLQTDRANYILTIYEKRVAERDLPFFLGLMDHLADRSFPCPTPIHDRDGDALRRLAGKPAAVVSFLEGISIRRPTADHCAQLGATLAQLHLAGSDFTLKRDNALSVHSWRPLFEGSHKEADSLEPGLGAHVAQELTDIEQHWPTDLPHGVIHADLFPDNVLFLENRLSGFIDFYFACNDFYVYDLAVCLNAWCFEPDGSFNITKARAMLTAYRRQRAITPAELAALPLLARGAALRFLLTRLHDWLNQVPGALVRPKDPLEYWRKLQFHRGVTGPSAYGLE